ncbi:MAG: MFS transporter [Peptococcaceae bacterium]|nr:MFS transporter [Peptococcaceae bacterium]
MENQSTLGNQPVQKYSLGAKIAAVALIVIQFTQALASPALASIQAAFPNVDTTIIQQIIALPTMLMVFSSMFCGRLIAAIGYRKTSYIAIVLSLVGGFMPAIIHSSIWVILFWRAIFGLGYGLTFALCVAVIGAAWVGQEQRILMGAKTGIGALCAMGYSTISGYLAQMSWEYVFYAYLIIIPLGLIIVAWLPEPPRPQPKKKTATDVPESKLAGFGSFYFMFVILACISVAFTAAFMNNSAMIVVGTGMGEPKNVGFVMTIFSLGMGLGGLSYAIVKKIMKRFMLTYLFLVFGINMWIMCTTDSLAVFTINAFIHGFLFGGINPEYEFIAINSVKSRSRMEDGVAIYVALQGIGQFIGPFLCAGLAVLFGLTGVYYQLNATWPILLASGIVLLIIGIMKKRDPAAPRPDQVD